VDEKGTGELSATSWRYANSKLRTDKMLSAEVERSRTIRVELPDETERETESLLSNRKRERERERETEKEREI